MTNIAVENHHFEWENPLSMAIFHGYVKLPEGNVEGWWNFLHQHVCLWNKYMYMFGVTHKNHISISVSIPSGQDLENNILMSTPDE